METLRELTDDVERLAAAPPQRGEDARLLNDSLSNLVMVVTALLDYLLQLIAGAWNDGKFNMLESLESSAARRIFRAKDFQNLVIAHRPGVSASSAQRALHDMRAVGALLRLTRGLYLNKCAFPPVHEFEVAQHLRVGAVISLHSALDAAGFLRHPTDVTVAVVPDVFRRPRFEEVQTEAGSRFWFFSLDQRFFRTGPPASDEVRQECPACPAFRAEAALLQWLHLASLRPRALPPPSLDVDMSTLDLKVLKRLAHHWLLLGNLTAYLASVSAYQARRLRRRSNKA